MNVIYIRTSTEEQNPKNQLQDCLSINACGEYILCEEQQSAWKDNIDKRDKFKELLYLIKQKQVQHLIVWDIDRIYRNRKRIIAFFKLCKMYGCKIHSYRQKFFEALHTMPEPFNEAMFDFMLQMMGWFAEDESNKKSQRVKAAVRREEDGITISYKGNRWGRKPLSKRTIHKVLELKKQGKSIREIRNETFYWDKNNNQKQVSIGAVHKILSEHQT